MNYKINNHFAKIKENKLDYQFVFFSNCSIYHKKIKNMDRNYQNGF